MGEVYRATDTALGRQVAIKVLPDALAQDAERLARFEREAKTLASLNNHPHIAQIYGLEKSSGVQALVMELVEGEDLSQRIARRHSGPLQRIFDEPQPQLHRGGPWCSTTRASSLAAAGSPDAITASPVRPGPTAGR